MGLDQGWRRRRVRWLVFVIGLAAAAYGLSLSPNRYRFIGPNSYRYISNTFETWDRTSVFDHLLLSFPEPGDFEQRRAYTHASPVWNLAEYAMLKPLRALGLEYRRGQSLMWMVLFPLLLWVVLARLDGIERYAEDRPRAGSALTFLTIAIAAAIVATLPSFWIGFVHSPDRSESVAFVALTVVAALDFDGRGRGRTAFLACLAAVLCTTYLSVFVIATYVVLFSTDEPPADEAAARSRWPWRALALCAGAAISVGLPWLFVRVGGFSATGSSIAYRSGLDGSQRYFTSMAQAVFWPPFANRAWHVVPLPIAALAGVLAALAVSRELAGRMLRQLFISVVPYLLLVAVFPQSVANHPHLYDFGLMFPAAFCLVFWLSRPEVAPHLERHRAPLLAVLIALVALLTTNYLDLARMG